MLLLSNSLDSIFDKPEEFYSDAKLVLANGHEVSFHRCILLARIPLFKTALARAEKIQVDKTTKLELKEIAKDYEVGFHSVITVLAYAYSNRIKPPPKEISNCLDMNCCHLNCRPTVNFFMEVLYLAYIFQIPELVTRYQVSDSFVQVIDSGNQSLESPVVTVVGNGSSRLELVKAQIEAKLNRARELAASVTSARKNAIRKRRKASKNIRLASTTHEELEKQLEEAIEAEDFDAAERISESLAAKERDRLALLALLRQAEC
ncbi:BTB/POZ domain [Arabidopsis thaliana x Arabidopsis arenosa]|uniref:BTB/POZ domain n=1 Tax=Arabidopsis thaliana x Arabidopsis arenosa TaxID=1240361 RepID=A0A8T2C7H6_9BRAS|nr:BTB/POZ domain [Arabidopsis thaliana x Arabidopsis arenosa]